MNVIPYRYQFEAGEATSVIRDCCLEHGFAIVKKILAAEKVEELKASVREVLIPEGRLGAGMTNRYDTQFIESSPALLSLLNHPKVISIARALAGTDQVTLHRSAAIVRTPGDAGMSWHSDFTFPGNKPQGASQYLNIRHEGTSMWFYLTGCNPESGGIGLIPDSHRLDWPGPEGFEMLPSRSSFYRKGTPPKGYLGMDVPGMLPVRSDPGDMILFDLVTYHGVYPHVGGEARLSCGFVLRPGQTPFPAPWALTESARKFIASAPGHLEPVIRYYVGLDRSWRPATV